MTKEITKKKKALETLRDQGLLTPAMEEELRHLLQVEEDLKKEEKNDLDDKSREAESILALIRRQDLFTSKVCKYRGCNSVFASNYADVAYCSNRCRRLKLEEQGIIWDHKKPPAQRWGWRGIPEDFESVPLVVPAEALKAAAHHPVIQQFLAETLIEQVADDRTVDASAPSH